MVFSEAYFIKQGYIAARQLKDGTWIGIDDLIFYISIYVGLDASGWAKRYDYERENLFVLQEQYLLIKEFDDIPIGWVSKRPN